ncbi:MAG: ABC transporter ATP-binding protein [Candidatus Omnitrophica bacterium]|nr:ABC transporter ATP-binding protein [Candidatus Omnitrophota bacterium]
MRNYLRLIKLVRHNLPILILAIGLMLISSLFDGISLGMIIPLVDKILAGKEIVTPPNANIPQFVIMLIDTINSMERGKLLGYMIFWIMGLFAIKEAAIYGQSYFMTDVGMRVVRDLRAILYNKLLSLSLDFFHRNKIGVLMSRVINDTGVVNNAISEGLTDLIYQPVQLIVYFVSILLIRSYFGISWWFVSVTLVFAPLIILPVIHIGRRLRKISTRSQEKIADITGILLETISGIRVVKAFNMEDPESEKFKNENHKYYRFNMKSVKRMNSIRPVTEFAGIACMGLILWFGGKEVIYGNLSPGAFVAFLAGLLALAKPAKRLSRVHVINQQALAAVTRIFSILDERPLIEDAPDATELQPFRKAIQLEGVNFSYGQTEILRDINVSVRAGEIVAIVGPSGVGKTTLINLIPRFYDPTKGSVSFDGVDIKTVSRKTLCQQIGIVTQETMLFNDTVFANIRYGKSDAAREEVIEAARIADAHDFILRLPNGYDTVVGDRGHNVSGGQRQRLAIARAVLKNPPILILDEAMSQLDMESEHLVQEALNRLMRNRTVLVIAHRLSTVRNADRIIVLEDGCIVDEGKHEELISRGGIYKKLYQLQFKDEAWRDKQ